MQTGSRPHCRQKHTDTMIVPLERLALSSRSKVRLQQCNSLLSFNNENIQKRFFIPFSIMLLDSCFDE